ncbi:MAG: hypothetical protein CVU38_10440, partial [Chloroflexi bacterium HGW-Chloroflexi-1]
MARVWVGSVGDRLEQMTRVWAGTVGDRPERAARNLRAEAAAERKGTLIGLAVNAGDDSPLAGVQVVAVGLPEELPPYRVFLPVVAKRRAVTTSDTALVDAGAAVAAGGAPLGSSVTFTTTTAADGSFALTVPAGAYTLTLTLANFGLDRRTATVRANEISRVADVRLHALDPVVVPVGAGGGNVTNSLGNTSLQFPAGAVAATQQARVTYLPNAELPGFFPDGSVPMGFAGLEPEGLVFPPGKEVLWTVAYTGTLPVGTDTLCYWWDGKTNRWRDPVPGKVVDLGGGRKALQARVTHFSAYGHALPGIAGQQPGGGQASVTTANGGQGGSQTQCPGCQINVGTGSVSESYTFLPVSSRGPAVVLALRYGSSNDTPTVTARVPFTITSQWPARAEWRLDFQGKTYTGEGYDARADWDTRNGLGQRVAPGPYTFDAWETFYYDSGQQPTLAVSGTVEVRRGDISPFGFNWLSSYDTLLVNRSSTVTIILGDGQYLSYVESFDAAGRLTRLQDPNGNAQTLTYEPTGAALPAGAWGLTTRLAGISDPSGRSWTLSYGADGYVNRVTDPLGRAYTLAHDAVGNLTAVTDPLGRTTTYRYDENHLLIGYTYPAGNSTALAYDAERRLIGHTDALGQEQTATYSASANTFTDERGNATSYQFNSYGAITRASRRSPAGNPVQTFDYTFDEHRQLAGTDPPYRRFTYDNRGNLTGYTSYTHVATTYEPSYSQSTSITDGAGNVTRFGYDARGNLATVTDALGQVARFDYDGAGQIIRATDPLNQVVRCEYDGFGNLTRLTDPLGFAATLAYDATGNLAGTTDAENHATSYNYDMMDRLTSATDALGRTVRYEYDRNNNLTRFTDGRGNATTYTYDNLGRLARETDPLGHSTSYAYDPVGNLISRTDANGAATQYSYDAVNRLTEERYPDGRSAIYTYDAINDLTGYVDANVQVTYTYPSAIPGRPDTVETRLLSNPAVRSVVSYDYVAVGGAAAGGVGSRGAEEQGSGGAGEQGSGGAGEQGSITPPRSPDLEAPRLASLFTSPLISTSTLTSTFPSPPPAPSTTTPYREVGRSGSAPYTDVCGSISTSTTWTRANSPYVATCSVTVASGVTLTIEPGVVVKFRDYGDALWVNGTLIADGTDTQPITFTSLKDDAVGGDTNGDGDATQPAPANWDKLHFSNSSTGSVLN